MTDDTFLQLDDQPVEARADGLLAKLKRGLGATQSQLGARLERVLGRGGTLDEEAFEALEETLISIDLGVESSLELVETLREDYRKGAVDAWKVRERLVDEISVLLLDAPRPSRWNETPALTLVVGVNGAGKTTSIAKLARRMQSAGSRVVLAAADTFRAAAGEQLAIWGERLGIDVIRGQEGGDPGAVVFDAMQAARARSADHLLVDTAGRLHNKEHLMAELGKMRRIIQREAQGWTYRGLLVLDATTGHNALQQARIFADTTAIDGVLLAKIDGTARGGMAVAISRELRLPVMYLGVGEGADDLIDFQPREFARALVGTS